MYKRQSEEIEPENGRDIDSKFIRSNFFTSEPTEVPEGFGLIGRKEARIFCCSDNGMRKEAEWLVSNGVRGTLRDLDLVCLDFLSSSE